MNFSVAFEGRPNLLIDCGRVLLYAAVPISLRCLSYLYAVVFLVFVCRRRGLTLLAPFTSHAL
jgi:hypothetical protein